MWGIIIYDENYFISKNEYFTLNSFEFENGGVLNDVNVEYMSFGTPIYDDNGIIKNAIVYCHGSLGSYSSIKKLAPLLGENDAFDENKYFFICISALGSPGSCSPSSTDLKNKFPKYSIRDVVKFQKKFLAEKFNINHVLGMIGNSMGGFVCLTSAINFPDYADFIICGVSSYKVAGHDFILSQFVNEIIESDPDYNKGDLTYSLIRTLRIACLAEFNFGLSKKALRDMSKIELSSEFENFGNESIETDIYDLKYCNEACMYFDVEEELGNIKSKTLIIACNQDPHFPPELDAIPMSKMINGSKLVIMDSDLGHLCFNELDTISNELKEFMEGLGDC
ncbi:homoserine O-acetyltransferase [Methanobrevibacter gottschalkii]|uniref:Homoserine O-acetyltransferase n=2 Tax=Methanobrevibacter gottschalkii TaxID=190974 RepID=A0A3N5B014_9EURY|nr:MULTISPECIES: alpha/beta fold hydrolase [Methanobrevibacter]OEC99585.1 homoserine acetyltransferase [Methanobrevibacter sp. A27]RPF50509.1 homoserine O-acetyltransferase [Methanobrevibacter gottschalkii DSM 11977]SEK88855.1 homoserine O-acetyltransferase [Methanobrevibacter gottschalkii]